MRLEIVSAADFLVQLLRLQSRQLSENQLQLFKGSLTELLKRRYRDHWFPDKPNRGSGYRCLRINGKMDPVIAQAGINVGLLPALLHRCFPSELTMWIDPAEVSYRIGENGSICVLFEGAQSGSESDSTDTIEQVQPERFHLGQHLHQQSSVAQSRHHYQQQHHQHQQQQQQFLHFQHQQPPYESCKDSLLLEHTQFSEQIAAFVSS